MKKPERVTYEVHEVATRLGISRNAAYAAIRAGEIPSIRVGQRRIIVPIVAFDAWLASSGGNTPPRSGDLAARSD